MKFYINKIILWLNNGKKRELDFLKNKVNIITGESSTGKSEILSIIDYCFFASKIEITEEKINENVRWYGINFTINDKIYTIARGNINEKKPSKDYYFSAIGHIPDSPTSTIKESDIKAIIEKEFSITNKTVFPYGGKKIKLGSKISPRYFFMFNTQSGDVISHSEVFFDKQNDDKYREALTRIFDLAVGIETEENISIREKVNDLEKQINSLQRKQSLINNKYSLFSKEIATLIKNAQTYNLIELNPITLDEGLHKLKEIANNFREENIDLNLDRMSDLSNQKNTFIRKIRNLKKFEKEFHEYRVLESENLDSLKPVIAIKEIYSGLIPSPEVELIINVLAEEYYEIKSNMMGKPPFEFDVDRKIKDYELEVERLNELINEIPLSDIRTRNEIDKLIFIGELRTKLNLFTSQWTDSDNENLYVEEIEELTELKTELSESLIGYSERKEATIKLLDEIIQTYLEASSEAIPTYKGYKSAFQYIEKSLKLKAPKDLLPSKVGSSSNHLFLHLCLVLGLQELIIRQKSPYVPYWLILDQPSRPYFGEENSENENKKEWKDIVGSDRAKITIAMKLLNDFISYVNTELEIDYQIIVLEHIPKSIWEDSLMSNFYLVDEEFRDGNALIRFDENGEPY